MGQIAQDAPLFKRIIVFVPKNAVFSEQTCHFEGFVPVFGHFSEQIFSYADIALSEYAIPSASGSAHGLNRRRMVSMSIPSLSISKEKSQNSDFQNFGSFQK